MLSIPRSIGGAKALVLSSFFFTLLGLTSSGLAQITDEKLLRELADKSYAALQRKDAASFRTYLIAPEAVQPNITPLEYFQIPPNRTLLAQTIHTLKLETEKANVQLNITVSEHENSASTMTLHRVVHCVKANGEWKIQQVSIAEKELAELLVTRREERENLLNAHADLLNPELLASLQAQVEKARVQDDEKTVQEVFEVMQLLLQKSKEPKPLIDAMQDFGMRHYKNGEYDLALKYLTLSKNAAIQSQYKSAEDNSTINIGNTYFMQTNYLKAEGSYLAVLKSVQGEKPSLALLRVTNNLGAVYLRQGDFSHALEKYEAALALVQQLNAMPQTEAEKKDTLSVMTKAIINRGYVRLAQTNYDLAREDFQRAEQIASTGKFIEEEYLAQNGQALTYEAQEKFSLAIEVFQRSLHSAQNANSRPGQADILNNLGNTYRLQGDHTKALEYFNQSLLLGNQFGLKEVLWKVQTRAARSYRALGKVQEARQSLEAAISLVETIRTPSNSPERPNTFDGRLGPYYEFAEFEMSQNNNAAAYTWMQKTKGRALLEIMQAARNNEFDMLPTAERKREKDLRQEVLTRHKQWLAEKAKKQMSDAALAALYSQVINLNQKHEQLLQELNASHPELRLRRGEVQALSSEKIAQLLPDTKTAILDYLIADDKGYLVVITKDEAASLSYQAYPLKTTRKELSQSVEQFRRRLANKDFSYQAQARQFFQLLVQPAAQQLQGKRLLLIIPDAALWELPFQALLTPNNQFLLKTYNISYVPSLPVLEAMTKVRAREHKFDVAHQLLAVGNPKLANVDKINEFSPLMGGDNLAPLPEAERQVLELQRMYGATHSRTYIGAMAREETVKKDIEKYRIVHLATHGRLDDNTPLYSGLLMASPQANSQEDGVLEAREILNLRLNADLAILSACETARGKSGEGLIGLSWVLAVAGCPTILVSQWKLESRSTADLMLEFHQGIKGNAVTRLTIAESLREAALKLMRTKQYSHPFYWAGFVVVGDGMKKLE